MSASEISNLNRVTDGDRFHGHMTPHQTGASGDIYWCQVVSVAARFGDPVRRRTGTKRGTSLGGCR